MYAKECERNQFITDRHLERPIPGLWSRGERSDHPSVVVTNYRHNSDLKIFWKPRNSQMRLSEVAIGSLAALTFNVVVLKFDPYLKTVASWTFGAALFNFSQHLFKRILT